MISALQGVLLLTLLLSPSLAQDCKGGFDVYFVLDGSLSMNSNDKWNNSINFITGMMTAFTNPKTRFSLIRFEDTNGGSAVTYVHLSNNKTYVNGGITQCAAKTPIGGTYIAPGLQAAYDEINIYSGTIPTIFLITDGVSSSNNDKTDSISVANKIRSRSANLFCIGIGNDVDKNQLNQLANTPSSTYVKLVSDKEIAYSSLVTDLVNSACIQVDSITPETVCVGETVIVNITGKGFNKNQNSNNLKCRFGTYLTPAVYISPTRLMCESPKLNITNNLFLEIQISSTAATQSNITFYFNPCEPAKPFDWLLLAYIAAGVIPFLIFLCWFFWPLMMGVSRKKETAGPVPLNQDPAALPPGKKWADVDTSKYVWSREGGSARPMPVKWGDLGPTAGAGHLEASGFKEGIDEPLLEGQDKPGCCTRCCFSCRFCCGSCYRRCADCRPHRG